ncbi:MAG: AI-2E family transporter [Proteobacteria bacterium]|nr:AI-2E family transporter [Pseudomonadota bacterium]
MPLTSVQKRAIAWLVIAGLVLLALLRLGAVLTPFVVAGVLAYALTPVVDWLDRVGRGFVPRWLSALGVELLLIVVLLGLMLLVVPILSKDIPLMRDQVPLLLDRLTGWLGPLLAQFGVKFSFDTASIKAALLDYLNGNTESMLSSLLSSLKVGGSVAVAVIGNAVLIPVALFYLLMDWDRFVAQAVALVPPHLRQAFDSFRIESNTVLGQYLRGQLLVMLVLAIYYSVGLTLFGLELALPVGIFTGLAVFVPYVGFGLGLTLATLAGLLQFASLKAVLMVAVVYGIGQVIEGFFLTPRLVGERIGLHPLVVIFALLAFGQLFGFVGVLVALPASALLLVAARRLRASYLASRLYLG